MTDLPIHAAVAWVIKTPAGLTVNLSAIHRAFENGKTFCQAKVPPESLHLPPLSSLNVCSKCERMSKRVQAMERQEAKMAAVFAA